MDQATGPLVDDGAPYSAFANVQLRLLTDHFEKNVDFELEPTPLSLSRHTN